MLKNLCFSVASNTAKDDCATCIAYSLFTNSTSWVCLQHHEDFGYFSDMMFISKRPKTRFPEFKKRAQFRTLNLGGIRQTWTHKCPSSDVHLDPVNFTEISSSSVSVLLNFCLCIFHLLRSFSDHRVSPARERVLPSVVDQSAGDHQGLLGLLVHLQEVFIAWSAAEPRLPKVHTAGKQEAASTGPNAAPQRCPDLAQPRQTPGFREQRKLLLVNPRRAHSDHCCFQIWVRIHWTDVSSNH